MIKKVLTYSVAIATIVWSVGLLATPLAVGAAVSGDLIKLQCAAGADVNDPCKAVYYLGADGKRYVFPNEKTYKTWYSDFSGVQIVSSTEMSSYAIGGNVTYRPGVQLVKITTDPKVYAVSGNGTLRWVTTGEIAESLFGATWASMVHDIPDAFFVNYTVGADINAAGDYDKAGEMSDSSTINDDKNLGGGGVSTGTSLTVALAADTPATGIVVANSVNNKFTKVTLTASADGAIVIDQLVVRRGGTIASDGPFSSIALIDAATDTRIGNTKTLNSAHEAVFNQDITIPAGTTKTIYLAANMGTTSLYAGEIPTLDLSSITLSGSAAVIGTLPLVGNYQNINGTITIGTLTLYNGSNNPSAATQKIGVTDYIVSGIKLTAGSAEDFKVNQISFKQGGTASDSDVANLDLFVDDVKVATVAEPTDGMVTFNLASSPILVQKGRSVQIDLQLDIVSGSDRTIRFDVDDESDIRPMGQLYGSEVKVGCGSGCTVDGTPFWTAPSTLIDRGALRISSATLSNANVPEDSTQVVLGKFEFEAKGEGAEITSLPIHFLITTSTGDMLADTSVDLTNVTVYDENGVIVAGPSDPTHKFYEAGTQMIGVTTTDTISVPAGLHYYTVKADLDSDFGTGDKIVAHIKPAVSATVASVVAKGTETGLAIIATPATEQASATMTVQSAALAVSVSPLPVAQSVVAGTKGYTFANIILGAASSGEDVKVTKINVKVDATTGSPSETSNWSLFDGATELATTNDPDSDTSTKTTASDNATATFMLSTPLVITKGTSKTLTVKADVSSSATNAGTFNVGMADSTGANHVTAKGNTTGLDAAITMSVSNGQTMTITTKGTLTISLDESNSPKEGLLPASTSGLTLGIFNIFGRYEPVNIEKLYLTAKQVNSGGLDQVETLYLYNGSTLLAEVTPTSTDDADRTVLFDVTNSPIVVPKDGSISLTVKAKTSASDYYLGSIGTSGQGLYLKVNATGDVTAKGAQSGSDITTITLSNAETKSQYLFKSVPTVTTNDLLSSGKVAGGALSSGSDQALYAFSVSADSASDIALHHVAFNIATNTATITNMYVKDSNSQKIAYQPTTALTYIAGSKETLGTDTWNGVAPFFFVNNQTAPTAYDASNVVPYTITKGNTVTFTLYGDISCTIIGGSTCSGTSGSGSVYVQLLGDAALPGTLPSGGTALSGTAANLMNNSFLWSDLWRTPKDSVGGTGSTTASTTEQWSNGTYVALSNGGKMAATSTSVLFSR